MVITRLNGMNICGFSRVNYWHGLHGGMDVHGRLLSEGLVGRGHQVSILSTSHPSNIHYEQKNGVQIKYLANTVFGARRQGWSIASALEFQRLHNKQPFDIIWSQSFDGFGLVSSGKIFRLPIIATIHGSIEQELKTFLSNFKNNRNRPGKVATSFMGLFYSYFAAQRPLLKSANKIIAVSQKVKSDLNKWYGQSISGKCETVPNGVDVTAFRPYREYRKKIRLQYGINANDILLLSLGRLTREKGHHIALEATRKVKKRIKGVKLFIVGEGNIRKELETQICASNLKDDVHFIGAIENEETAKFYNAADIFLMPTLAVEGMPYVLLEAMACAKPVLASRIGGNVEIIVNGLNGLLFKPGDVTGLTEKIIRIVREPMLRDKISSAARETVEKRYSVNNMINSVEKIMESALRNTHSSNLM